METPLPAWSALAIESDPDAIVAIHRDYAQAGADVHTANTFRAGPRTAGMRSLSLCKKAVELARRGALEGQRVAGSMAPLEDCYRPDLSPESPEAEHRVMAGHLVEAGCDLLLCETFPHGPEALAAVRAARSTGLETWLALTPGPEADLLTPLDLARIADQAGALGASHVLVNCVGVPHVGSYLEALLRVGLPVGVYANAGRPDDHIGWTVGPHGLGAQRYAEAAMAWVEAGASVVGGCCGTGPEHLEAVVRRYREMHGAPRGALRR